MILTISKEFRFEASHVLPKHPGKCSRLHGHSWVLRVSVQGPVDPDTGFVLDYAELKKCVQPTIDLLDHSHLGYGYAIDPNTQRQYLERQCPLGLGFYPSSENLVVAIARILQPLIPEIKNDVRLFEVSLDETCTSRATWRAE